MQKPECKECGGECEQIGTNWCCPFPDCERYATPCPHIVHGVAETAAEYEAACEAQSDRQSEKYAERIMNGERT